MVFVDYGVGFVVGLFDECVYFGVDLFCDFFGVFVVVVYVMGDEYVVVFGVEFDWVDLCCYVVFDDYFVGD